MTHDRHIELPSDKEQPKHGLRAAIMGGTNPHIESLRTQRFALDNIHYGVDYALAGYHTPVITKKNAGMELNK